VCGLRGPESPTQKGSSSQASRGLKRVDIYYAAMKHCFSACLVQPRVFCVNLEFRLSYERLVVS
jgi:hypothetical protein